MPLVTSIKKVGRSVQKCISVSSDDGLFVVGNGIVTHNCDEKIFNFYSKLKERIFESFSKQLLRQSNSRLLVLQH